MAVNGSPCRHPLAAPNWHTVYAFLGVGYMAKVAAFDLGDCVSVVGEVSGADDDDPTCITIRIKGQTPITLDADMLTLVEKAKRQYRSPRLKKRAKELAQ